LLSAISWTIIRMIYVTLCIPFKWGLSW
jgi:hypothetical protein